MRPKFFLLIVLILLILAGFLVNKEKAVQESHLLGEKVVDSKLHQTLFFEPHNFYQGVNSVKNSNLKFTQEIKGGIVPHHLLASEILSDFFLKLSKQAPEVMILVGPNHKAVGENIQTSDWDWQTPFGNVKADPQVVEGLVKSGFANENNETVGSEHSVGGTMPYLAYYLSDTKVVPIILSSQTPLVKVQKLGDYLAQLMKGKNWIIVAPVDFAHEVTSQRAEANDAITEGLIRNFDFATLFTLSNEYLDSGPAIGVLLQAMQNIGATDVETLNHTNSGLLLGSQSFLVTSYFEMVFYQAEIPPLTIEGVFSANHEVADLPLGELRTLIVTGDVLLARSVNFQMHQQGDFRLPFQRTAEVLQGADLSLVNLENPIVKDCPLTNEGMVFCGSPEVVEGLTYAGVDIASLANNHCRDRGEAGLRETVNILEKEGIDTLVQGKILVKDVKGARFAFFGYDTVRIAVSDDEVRDSIKKAKSMADIVIVYFHWGVEYVDTPTQKQKDLAHLAIDSGADLVLGSHPHWVQGVEIYQDKLIVYSHGNFIFDQMFSKETKTGVIGRYTFYKEKLVDVEFLPVYMEKFPCPHLLIGDGGKAVLEQMRKRSL